MNNMGTNKNDLYVSALANWVLSLYIIIIINMYAE